MCLNDTHIPRPPQLSDAIPMADLLCVMAYKEGDPQRIATLYEAAAILRHLHSLLTAEESKS